MVEFSRLLVAPITLAGDNISMLTGLPMASRSSDNACVRMSRRYTRTPYIAEIDTGRGEEADESDRLPCMVSPTTRLPKPRPMAIRHSNG